MLRLFPVRPGSSSSPHGTMTHPFEALVRATMQSDGLSTQTSDRTQVLQGMVRGLCSCVRSPPAWRYAAPSGGRTNARVRWRAKPAAPLPVAGAPRVPEKGAVPPGIDSACRRARLPHQRHRDQRARALAQANVLPACAQGWRVMSATQYGFPVDTASPEGDDASAGTSPIFETVCRIADRPYTAANSSRVLSDESSVIGRTARTWRGWFFERHVQHLARSNGESMAEAMSATTVSSSMRSRSFLDVFPV